MKKCIVWLLAAMLLSGCGAEPVYETIGDVCGNTEPVTAPGTMEIAVPEGAQMQTSDTDSVDTYYTIGDWEVWTQILESGDIHATLETITGMDSEALTVVCYEVDGMDCHETTWTSTGEDGILVGRVAVLDDGKHHYCLALTVPQNQAGDLAENFGQLLDSVTITGTES